MSLISVWLLNGEGKNTWTHTLQDHRSTSQFTKLGTEREWETKGKKASEVKEENELELVERRAVD